MNVNRTSAGHALITLDATRAACWQGEMTCDRLTLVGTQGDVQLDTKLDALPPVQADATSAGILVYQDDSNFLRFEVQAFNQSYRVDAHAVIGGVGTAHVIGCDNLTLSAPVYLRVNRTGDSWTLSYSADGATFIGCGSFTQPMTASRFGLYADNEASNLSLFTAASFDYFHVTDSLAPVPSLALVYDVNSSLPNVSTDGALKCVYRSGLDYAVDSAGEVHACHAAGLGSVRVVADGSGLATQTCPADDF